ncbi:MAG: N-acetylmuramoyl-L-alanine amidase [bacterium]
MSAVRAAASSNGPEIEIHKNQSNQLYAAKFIFSGQVQIKSFYLTKPDRFIVDFIDAVATEGAKTVNVGASNVETIRIAQNSVDPNIVRAVFDLKSARKFGIKSDATGLIITVFESGAQVSQAKAFPKVSVSKSWDRVETRLTFKEAPKYEEVTTGDDKKFALDFTGYKPAEDLEETAVDAGAIKTVRVAHYEKGGDITRLVIETYLPARVNVEKKDEGKTLVVTAYQPSLYGAKIAIDAGHGGKDPGAMTDNGLVEKDIVLDVALRLKALLVAAGANVIMTRETDDFITLNDRPFIANKAGVELFLSIHANALPDHQRKLKCRGLQMFYGSKESEQFARVMLGEELKVLGTGDQGMFERNLLVLRKTQMKAALVEIGFITHPNDAALLMDDTFRENAARGLYNGLEKFKGGRGVELAALRLPPEIIAHLPSKTVDNKYLVSYQKYDYSPVKVVDVVGEPAEAEDGVFVISQQPAQDASVGKHPVSDGVVRKGSPMSVSNPKYDKQK